MALVIEDGSGLPDASSFATVAELEAFALARGITLPAEEADKEVLLVKGADYLILRESEFQGARTKDNQALPFPRESLVINCKAFPDDAIPAHVKLAQMQAAVEASKAKNGLSPAFLTAPVVKEKVDVVERQYMTPRQMSTRPDGSVFQPLFPQIDAYLFPLLRGNECPGKGQYLKLERI